MMGRLKSEQGQLFCEFCLGDAVPEDHLVRKIDAALDLSWLRSELGPHYSSMGRPSIDPELMIRMLVVGYVFAIRSERLICREVQVNLAYRWFCKLGIEDAIPDHSAFSRARNERFREGEVFRRVFERVVEACIAAGLVGGEGFAVDASLIQADANKQRSIAGQGCPGGKRLGTSGTVHEGKTLSVSCKQARLRCMPAQTAVLSKRTIA
jgi:transposase